MNLTLYPAALTQAQFEAGNPSLCALPLAMEPVVNQAINGDWSLSFSCPLGSIGAGQLALGMLILANGQLYRIDSIERNGGRGGEHLQVHALHLLYDLRDKFIVNIETAELTPGGVNQRAALQQVLCGSGFSDGVIDTPVLLDYLDVLQKDAMWAIKEQVLPLWGGELQPDNWTLNIREEMGSSRGAQLRYGKNMLGVKYSESMDGVITRLHILGYRNANIESINGGLDYIDSVNIGAYPTIREGLVTFNDDDLPEDLLNKGQEYLATMETPRIKLSVDLAKIRESEQYRHYKDLEAVGLGDTVTVWHSRLNINIAARVQSRSYNPVSGENLKVELGNDKRSLYSAIASAQQAAEVVRMITDRKGHIRSEKLRGVIDLLTTQLMASGSFINAEVMDGKGALFENTDEASPDFGALYIGPGIFAIANTKDETGSWQWRTFGTGQGFTGAELTAESITANKLASGVGESLDLSSNQSIVNSVESLENSLQSELTQTAEGLTLEVSGVKASLSALETAARLSSSFITLGKLVDSDNQERMGIAIGENLLDENGDIVQNHTAVRIFSDRQTFYQNGVVGMELRNNGIQAARGSFDEVTLNSKWKQMTDENGSFAIMWVG